MMWTLSGYGVVPIRSIGEQISRAARLRKLCLLVPLHSTVKLQLYTSGDGCAVYGVASNFSEPGGLHLHLAFGTA